MGLHTIPPITRLDLASVVLPESHPAAPSVRTVPVFGYLIEHPDGVVVVDADPGLREAAVSSIRRIKALRPDAVHFSHCAAFHRGGA